MRIGPAILHAAHATLSGHAMTATSPRAAAIRSAPNPRCIVCQREGVELYRDLSDDLYGAPGLWRMVRCADLQCGLRWLDPKPLQADLIKAYATYHTHGRSRARRASELCLSALNSACKLVSRALDLGSILGAQRRQLRKMFLGDAIPGTLLEVGSGSGRFLNRMHAAGWRVQGTDFDPAAAARVKVRYGLSVDVGELRDLAYAEGSFDAIAMSQVIEHVYDPQALLAETFRLLRQGGQLVLSTPNADGLAHRRFGRHWRGLEPPRHLHLFTQASLRECARRAGFEQLRCFTLSVESAGIYRASDLLASAGAGRALGVLRSWIARHREFRASRSDPSAGQDLFRVAIK
jgi:2-polyprenyl-3-methyl-5-hydroxy-6-metoxy-1,4-benzoquinol methylase